MRLNKTVGKLSRHVRAASQEWWSTSTFGDAVSTLGDVAVDDDFEHPALYLVVFSCVHQPLVVDACLQGGAATVPSGEGGSERNVVMRAKGHRAKSTKSETPTTTLTPDYKVIV